MKRCISMLIVLCILVAPVCSARSIDEARQMLAQQKLDFTETQFLEAIKKKDNYAVSLFLDAGMNPNLVTANSTNPLKIAALFNNLDAVKLLLAKDGINVNWQDYGGRTAADIAYLFDNPDIAAALKEKDGSQAAIRSFTLTAVQLAQAMATGEGAGGNKKDIIFVEKDSAGAMQPRAYWLSPFCALANERMAAFKRYENVDPERIRILANTYQARIVFTLMPANMNQNSLEGLKVIGIQNGKILYPYWIDTTPLQQGTTIVVFVPMVTYKMGVIAYFNAHDIDVAKPIEIKIIPKGTEERTFKFTNKDSANLMYWEEEMGRFNWQ